MSKRLRNVGMLLVAFYIIFVTSLCFAAAPLSPIWSLEFSPDGKTLAVGKYQWVEIWDLETQRVIYTYEPHTGEVRSLTFSSDGETLYTSSGLASRSGEVRVWDVSSEKLIKSLEIHGDTIESISLSPHNTTLVTASMDEYSAVIDLTRLEDADFSIDTQVSKWLTQHVGRVLCTLYHPDGTYFVTGSEDKTIKVWDPNSLSVLVNLDANDDAVYSLAYSTEEGVIVSGSADNTVRTWRVTQTGSDDQSAVGQMTGTLVREYNGHQGSVYSVDAGRVLLRSANNRMTMIASGSADTSVVIWSLRSSNRYETFNESTDAVYAVEFSPNGEFVAAGGRDGKVRLYNLRKRALTHEFFKE